MREIPLNQEKKIIIEFNKRASEICLSDKGYKILKQKIDIIEINETPAFAAAAKIQMGISGIIECK